MALRFNEARRCAFPDSEFQDIVRGSGSGTKADPWRFEGEGGFPSSIAYRDKSADPPALVVEVGGQTHRFPLDSLDNLCTNPDEVTATSTRQSWLSQVRALADRIFRRN